MRIPRIDLAFLSRLFILLAIILLIYNEFKLQSSLVSLISLALAVSSVLCMVLFAIRFRQGKYNQNFQIVV